MTPSKWANFRVNCLVSSVRIRTKVCVLADFRSKIPIPNHAISRKRPETEGNPTPELVFQLQLDQNVPMKLADTTGIEGPVSGLKKNSGHGSMQSSLLTADSSVLDYLRAIAVSMVLCDHLIEAFQVSSLWWTVQRIGWTGVMLFFVHTSLVLMFSIDRTKAGGTTLLKHFYTRRAFRVYPLSIAIVIAVVTLNISVASWWFQSTPLTVSTLASNLLLIQNLTYSQSVLGPLWTLPLELQMYVMLPFLYWAVKGGRRLDFALLIWCGAVLFAFVQPHITDRGTVFQFAPCFAGGIIAFTLTRRAKAFLPFWTLTVFLAIALSLFLAFTVAQDTQHLMRVSWVLSLSVGFFLPHVKETKSNIVRSVSLMMAKYSYSIYLTHMIVLWVVFPKLQGANPLLRIFVGVALMFLLPYATYNLIEAPGIALGARLAGRFLTARRPATASSSPVAVNIVGS